jgi:hypothetical protein
MSIPRQVQAAAAEAEAELQRRVPPAPAPEPETLPPAPAPSPEEALRATNESQARRIVAQDGALKKQGFDIRDLRQQVAELTQKLEHVTAKQATPTPPPKPAPDLSDFDPKLIEAVDHRAEQLVAPLKDELEVARKEREERAKAQDRQRKADAATAFLDEFAPKNWREIDNSPEFAEYLSEFNPATGQPYGFEYDKACSDFDGPGIARIIRRFDEQRAAASKPATPPPPTAPVVPPVSGRAPEVVAPQGRTWTTREIDDFFADLAKGRLKSRGWTQQRIDETERDILAAYSEGRVKH